MSTIDKFILIDNGNAARHKDLFKLFEEVFFFERFRKNKIIEYNRNVNPAESKLIEHFE